MEGVCFDQAGKGIFVKQWIKLGQAVYLIDQDIFIGKGTRLEPSVILKGPAVIGKNCDIRQGAYVRGNIFAGEGCVIGHQQKLRTAS
ncbi:MAG: hypothetical protein CM1200mP16_13770 [Nitrospina sp.]|nr:MAG: hypothetical protein CM1200mP16_13770 [Nitrospina sp.]